MTPTHDSCSNRINLNASKLSNTISFDQPQSISIAWRNLRYIINDYYHFKQFKPVKKPILQRLNGYFEHNTLNALMGPSGSGKTTLLNCLNGTGTSGLTSESTIYVSSDEQTPVSYFIQQQVHQTIEPHLTVRQILQYAFQFKNGLNKQACNQMDQHISTTVLELLLNDNVLNQVFAKCSGGEQRRIAIGQELMALEKPQFLFIDEPTSGLDSFAALEVVKCLSLLAKNHHMTIITSIHAPSNELLHYFNKLYVLAKGVCIYSGPPKMLKCYLENKGNTSILDEEQPIEILIKIACNNLSCPKVQALADHCLTTEYKQISPHIHSLTCLPSGLPNARKAFSFVDLYLQIARQSRITFLAQRKQFLGQLITFTAVIYAFSTFYNYQMVIPSGCTKLLPNRTLFCENDTFTSLRINENINYLCWNRTLEAYIVIVTSSIIYSNVVKILQNEHQNRWYSLGAFYLATNIVSIFQITILALFLSTVTYFSVSEHAIDSYQINWYRFGHYICCIFLCFLLVQSYGQLVGTANIKMMEITIVFTSLIFSILLLVDDYFFKTDELKQFALIYVSNILAMKYVTRYIIFVFYGIDRCNQNTEYSWVMMHNYSNEDHISLYITRILLNVIVIRTLSFVLMYFKFNSFALKRTQLSTEMIDKLITIEYNQSTSIDLNENFKIERSRATQELQFEQFSKHKYIFGWRNLTLYRSKRFVELDLNNTMQPSKFILRNLNGQFKFNSLNALMGMSGAGKTSLLQVINGRHNSRLSNDSQFYLSKFTKIVTAFISQEVSNHLMRGLTAKQLLIYASKLKNEIQEQNGTTVDHEQIALKLLDELNLTDTVDTKVEYCSGGERKRLALALELTSLQMPNLICIDEPTSGLDSNSAEIIIATLRALTQNHSITIIASIHQPNTEMLRMFDQLYVLALCGDCVYSGPPNKIHKHFKKNPEIFTTECKYPIETLIKHSSSEHNNEIVEKLSQLSFQQISKHTQGLYADTQLVPDVVFLNRARFSLHSVVILTQRYFAYICGYLWKEWLLFFIAFIFYAFNLVIFFDTNIATTSGCINYEEDFNRCSRSTEKQLEEKAMFANLKYNLFFCNLFIMVVMMQTTLNLFKELDLFFNEHRNGWYSTGSFYLMKLLYEVLPLIPFLFIYVYICNIYESVQPGIYWHIIFIFLLAIIATQALAYIFLISCNLNISFCMVVGIGTYMTMLMLSNLFNSLKQLHYIYQFASYFSIPRFTIEPIILLEYGFGRCKPREVQPVLYWMNLADEDYVFGIGMLAFNLMFYRLVALWMLSVKVNQTKNRRQPVVNNSEYCKSTETTN